MLLQTIPIQLDTIDFAGNMAEMAQKIATTPKEQLIHDFIQDAIQFGIKVIFAILIYLVGAWIIKRVIKILTNVFERRSTEKAIASFVKSLVSITMTIILIIISISTLGVNTTSLAALLTAGGMAIGMALSGTVQNFAGGIMLLVFKPFKAGDFIEAQGFSGTVSEVNIVSTKLTTTDNRSIIIPNGALSNGTINNFSQNNIRRLEWLIDVVYGSDSKHTKEVLKGIVEADARVLYQVTGAPADPLYEINALRDSSVQFIVRAWVKKDDYWDVFFSINDAIYNELPKQGIEFPFPQLDVHIQ